MLDLLKLLNNIKLRMRKMLLKHSFAVFVVASVSEAIQVLMLLELRNENLGNTNYF
jgi:hypothetical protein